MIELYSKRDRHEHEPGDPRATSRQGFVQCQKQDIESTYHGGLLMKTQCCHYGNSSLSYFYRARCEDIHQFQDKIWIKKETYFGVLTYLPHTWSLQNFKCMEFKSPSIVVLHQGISRYCSRCSSHVRRCCLPVILLDLPLERLATKKYPKENYILEHALAFIEREINK